jgi:hypothetical protein
MYIIDTTEMKVELEMNIEEDNGTIFAQVASIVLW